MDAVLSNNAQQAFDISCGNDVRAPGQHLLGMEARSDNGDGECAPLAQLVSDFWIRHLMAGRAAAASAAGIRRSRGPASSRTRR